MHKYNLHDTWVISLLVLLYFSTSSFAQCPDTKSATYAMLPAGNPFYVPLQPSDFQVHPSDSALFSNMTLSQGHWTCGGVGIQEVFLSGVNAADESYSCGVHVWVYDSVQLCGSVINTPRAIAGKIVTDKNENVPNIAIGLSSQTLNYFRGSDIDGRYLFENFEPADYKLTPNNHFENNVRNGVSTFDLINIQKHILKIRLINSPYKIIAADVNSSGDITAYDMLLMRQLILSVIDEFPNTPSWKFVDAAFVFDEEIDPLIQDFSNSISLDMNELGPQLDNRFIAIKIGDLNNSVNLNNGAQGRSNDEIGEQLFSIKNKQLVKGTMVEVPFLLTQSMLIEGLQFAIAFDESKLSFEEVRSQLPISDTNYFVKDGLLTFSWTEPEGLFWNEEEAPFTLVFKAKVRDNLRNTMALKNELLTAELYSENGTIIPFAINWQQPSSETVFQSFDNYPNPFSNHTTIPFYLPQSNNVTLKVFNAKGALVFKEEKNFDEGFQVFPLLADFGHTGLYFYRLESISGTTSGKLNFVSRN